MSESVDDLPRIYLFTIPFLDESGWVHGFAITEDGYILAKHSAPTDDIMYELGVWSNWFHDIYEAKYPDGYELEWVGQIKSRPGLMEAIRLLLDKWRY